MKRGSELNNLQKFLRFLVSFFGMYRVFIDTTCVFYNLIATVDVRHLQKTYLIEIAVCTVSDWCSQNRAIIFFCCHSTSVRLKNSPFIAIYNP